MKDNLSFEEEIVLMWKNMCRGVLIAKNWLFEPYGACSLLVNAPIRDAFDCS